MFGVSRYAYRARFRFLRNDARPTYIRWTWALPGAVYDERPGVIHPFRDRYTTGARAPGECGELDYPRRTFVDGFPSLGQHGGPSDASDADVAGLTPFPSGPIFASECGAVHRTGPGGPMADGTARPETWKKTGPGGGLADGLAVPGYAVAPGPGGAVGDGLAVAWPGVVMGPGGAVGDGVSYPPAFGLAGPGGAVSDGTAVAAVRVAVQLGGAVGDGTARPPVVATTGPGGAVGDGQAVARAGLASGPGGAVGDGSVGVQRSPAVGPGGGVGDGSLVMGVEDVLTGSILGWTGLALPGGYLYCDGSAVSRITYAALFDTLAPPAAGTTTAGSAVLFGLPAYLIATVRLGCRVEGPGIPTGTTVVGVASPTAFTLSNPATASGGGTMRFLPFGVGDGANSFNLPDLSGRVPVGAGAGSGLTERFAGQTGGEERHLLTVAELASHQHLEQAYIAPSNAIGIAQSGSVGNHAATSPAQNTGTTGGDVAHNTMQPFAVMRFIVKT